MEKYLTVSEIKKTFKDMSKEQDMDIFQQHSLQHAESFSKISSTDVKKLKKELLELSFVDERHAIKMIDIMPSSVEEVLALYHKDKTTLEEKDIKNILEILGKYK